MVAQRVKAHILNRDLFWVAINAKIPDKSQGISPSREISENQGIYFHIATDRTRFIELLEQNSITTHTNHASSHIYNIEEKSGAHQETTPQYF